MRRREFLIGAGAAGAYPLAGRAQQSAAMRRIGVILSGAEADREMQARISALRAGLQALG